jgi:hypothetical protein
MTVHAHDISGNPSRTLAFTLTRSDVRRLSRYIYFQKKPFWTAFRLLGYGALVAWGMSWFEREVSIQLAAGNPGAMLGIALGTPPLLIGVLLLLVTAVQLMAANAPRPPDRKITVTDYGVHSVQSEWSIMMSWAAFMEIVLAPHAIYGFMTPVYALIIPSRAFENAGEMTAWYQRMALAWEEQRHSPVLPPPPPDAFSVTYTADLKAYEKASLWATRNMPRKTRILAQVIVPAVFIALVLVLNAQTIRQSPAILLYLAPCFLFVFVVSFSVARFRPRFVARQVARIRGSLTPQVLSLTPEGMISRGATTWSLFPWSQILKIQSDKDQIYFLLPGGSAAFVPRAAFLDGSEADAFLNAARAYRAGNAPQTEEGAVWPPRPNA